MKRALKLVSIFLIIILTGVCIGGIFREAKDFVRQNIYVWTEKDPDKLPIYCVDTKEKVIRGNSFLPAFCLSLNSFSLYTPPSPFSVALVRRPSVHGDASKD